jgi:hypothetical protein
MLSDERKRKHNLKMYIYVYVSNCMSAVFEAIVEGFVRQIKDEMSPEGRLGHGKTQRVFNVLYKTRLSPLPPLRLPVCRRSSLLPGEGVRGWWGRSQIIRREKSLVLYKYY